MQKESFNNFPPKNYNYRFTQSQERASFFGHIKRGRRNLQATDGSTKLGLIQSNKTAPINHPRHIHATTHTYATRVTTALARRALALDSTTQYYRPQSLTTLYEELVFPRIQT